VNVIKIKTQQELDALPDAFDEFTKIEITGKIESLNRNFKKCIVSVSGSASIEYVSDSASIKSVSDSASIKSVYGSASIKYVYDSASIEYVYGSASIKSVSGSASIKYVYDSASIKSVYGNSVVRVFSKYVKISLACKFSVVIAIGCKIKFKREKTVSYIENELAKFDLDEFIKRYDCKVKNGRLILYKIVKSDSTDFYSGTIKYEVGKTVAAPDWNPDSGMECGGGLHLSPSPKFASQFNKQGIVLRCSVSKKDVVVHPNPNCPHKVRCRAVRVIEDVTKKYEDKL
jgi:hypothetical protein